MDIIEMGWEGVDWFHVAMDRYVEQDLVNTVIWPS
jgi:hypothetical protein